MIDEEEPLPDRRKHGYAELEAKLNKHVKRLEERFSRFFIRALIAFAFIGICCAVAIAGFGYVLKEQGDTADAIQRQRYNVTLETCLDQNNKNKNVAKKIDEAIDAQLPKTASQKQKTEARKVGNTFKLIIGAAVPYTSDCKALAESRVRETP